MKKLLIFIGLFLFLLSCSKTPEFTDLEKAQTQLFIQVVHLDNQSISISNRGIPYNEISTNDIEKMLELKRKALALAMEIPDEVLAKMHDELPEEYGLYKKGLGMRIENLETENFEAELEGSQLVDNWIDWYTDDKHQIKIPKLRK